MSIAIKTTALCAVFLCFLYISFRVENTYKSKHKAFKALNAIVTDMLKRIQNYPVKLSEMTANYSDEKYCPFDSLFLEITNKLTSNDMRSTEDIFKDCASNSKGICEELKPLLYTTAAALGTEGRANITALLELTLTDIAKAEGEAYADIKDKGTLYSKLIRLLGLLIIILFI